MMKMANVEKCLIDVKQSAVKVKRGFSEAGIAMIHKVQKRGGL